MELVLLRDKRISLFGYGTFQRYVFMLSTRFVWTSGNGFNYLTKHGATFSSLYIARRTYWYSGYDEHACDTIVLFLMLETNEPISEIDGHHILQEASELSDRVPGNLSSQARW